MSDASKLTVDSNLCLGFGKISPYLPSSNIGFSLYFVADLAGNSDQFGECRY
jgi:hypothetical protein